ncbi:hypothetical protein [Jatrophihabitans sp.]|jgi:hypothetical protein|uniref:hypothetical protein n=1 Tax=Jatrophihabitans sp. TaxID=1932789 RepID=UPI002F113E2E
MLRPSRLVGVLASLVTALVLSAQPTAATPVQGDPLRYFVYCAGEELYDYVDFTPKHAAQIHAVVDAKGVTHYVSVDNWSGSVGYGQLTGDVYRVAGARIDVSDSGPSGNYQTITYHFRFIGTLLTFSATWTVHTTIVGDRVIEHSSPYSTECR